LRGVSDRHGNLIVLMTHNTDIADAWEREGEDEQYFYSFSPARYALGINVLLYTLTHQAPKRMSVDRAWQRPNDGRGIILTVLIAEG
jgi:hypothetical protein